MESRYRRAGRIGGLKTSQNRAHIAELGRRGGAKTAAIPGHMQRMATLSARARKKKTTS